MARVYSSKKEWNHAVNAGKITSMAESIELLEKEIEQWKTELKRAYQVEHSFVKYFNGTYPKSKPVEYWIEKGLKTGWIRETTRLIARKKTRIKKGYL
jgi:hypothetical protein